jgi:hypothetical protein
LPPTTPLIQAPADRLRYLRDLQQRASKVKTGAARYYNDPLGFLADCIDWRDGDGPTSYQRDVIAGIPQDKRVSVRGPHGLGKSSISAWTILWFALTRNAAGVDWKVATTAGSWHQISRFLWPEIHKWAQRIRWDKVRAGRGLTEHEELNLRLRGHPFSPSELMNLNLRLSHGAAFASASANSALIEGAHADSLLFVFDEAKAIPAATFDACEGALNGTGEAFALALSTPGAPSGRFYDIQSRKPGYEDWRAVHVTLEQAIAAGQIDAAWAAQRAKQWGTESSIYVNRVLGEFHAGDEDSVIPLAWAEAAVERWHEWDLAGRPGTDMDYPRTVGVDAARFGTDKTVLAPRRGPVTVELRRSVKEDTMQTTGRVKGIVDSDNGRSTPVVDVIGIGAGVVDRLREMGHTVIAFNASAGTDRRDTATSEMGFNNCRSAAWWGMRELLDPSAGSDVCLPDDELLLGDLSAPQWKILSGGKIAVESKDEIRKRLGRSTDDGDAVVQAYWPRSMPHSPSARQWAAHDELNQLTRDPSQRLRERLGQHDRDPGWDSPDAWAPQDDDGRPERPNVRSWR